MMVTFGLGVGVGSTGVTMIGTADPLDVTAERADLVLEAAVEDELLLDLASDELLVEAPEAGDVLLTDDSAQSGVGITCECD